MVKTGQDWHLKIEPSKPYFLLLSFLTRNTLNPQANICGTDSLRPTPTRQSFFPDSPIFKIWDWMLSPQQNKRGGWNCDVQNWHKCCQFFIISTVKAMVTLASHQSGNCEKKSLMIWSITKIIKNNLLAVFEKDTDPEMYLKHWIKW